MKTSKKFNNSIREILEQYSAAQSVLDDAYDAMLDKLLAKEEESIAKLLVPPVEVGARTWSSKHKRYATVTKAAPDVSILSDDYYGDRRGPGRYGMPDIDDDDMYGDCPSVRWLFTIQADPSPVRRLSPCPDETTVLTMEHGGKWMHYSREEWEETTKPKHA